MSCSWSAPIPLKLLPTVQSANLADLPSGWTGLPLPPHAGSFGNRCAHHIHEGVDLYCPSSTAVTAVEPGFIVAIQPFITAHCSPPFSPQHGTWAMMVEGKSGVVLYGAIIPDPGLVLGRRLDRGQRLGHVTQLQSDTAKAACILHLGLYRHGTRECAQWKPGAPRPDTLRDPTTYLIDAATQSWSERQQAMIAVGERLRSADREESGATSEI